MGVGEARKNNPMETLCRRRWFSYADTDRLNPVLRELK
jgi:hypothetical protein